MKSPIIERILNSTGQPDLIELLTDRIPLPDLQSLLLEVYRRKTKKITPEKLLYQYQHNRFLKPSNLYTTKFIKFDQLTFSLLPADFTPIELSPLSPLGSNSVLAPVDQNNTVSTIRNTEVSSDNTVVLALECALRRKQSKKCHPKSSKIIKLCSNQRLVRAQFFSESATFAHFKVLSLVTAGRDYGNYKFELKTINEMIGYFIKIIHFCKEQGFKILSSRIRIISPREGVLKKINIIKNELSQQWPGVIIQTQKDLNDNWHYYSNLRFQIFVTNLDNQEYLIVDGGDTDWTQQLLSDKKERLLIGGFGSERFIYCFG
jgi:hypothetical protein